jgi:hypothetical protein
MSIVIRRFILFFFAAHIIGACSTDEFCAEPTEALANLRFYNRVGRILHDTTVLGFSVSGLNISDSLLYDSVSASSFKLPFSATSQSISFILTFSIPDTLYLIDTVETGNQITKRFQENMIKTLAISKFALADSITIDTIPYFYYAYDTLSFFYTQLLQFISQSCGYIYNYQVDSVHSTTHVIDTVIINSANITTKGNENFKVLL